METPLAAARSLQDMLIQSWGDSIRVFPAVPAGWQEVAIHNLRTEGAFLVSAVRKAGRTQFIQLTSLAGEPCRVRSDLPDPIRVLGGREAVVRRLGPNLLEVNLYKGESVVVYSGDQVPDLAIAPVPTQEKQANSYGLKGEHEVWVISGQSNACGAGDLPGAEPDERVRAFDARFGNGKPPRTRCQV